MIGRHLLRAGLIVAGLWLGAVEIEGYRVERRLGQAAARLRQVLGGRDEAGAGLAALDGILRAAREAGVARPLDPAPALLEATVLLLLRDGPEAARVLRAAIHQDERPELTLNLGRALGIGGDEAGAQAAFLRTAWVSPASLSTLPQALRDSLLDQTRTLERALREGRLREPPPLARDPARSP